MELPVVQADGTEEARQIASREAQIPFRSAKAAASAREARMPKRQPPNFSGDVQPYHRDAWSVDVFVRDLTRC
jgi:hypothetical protein